MKKPPIELFVLWMSPICMILAVALGFRELWGWAILAALAAIWFEVSL